MQDIIFVHGMFQNPKSWENWTNHFSSLGYNCMAPAWPLHKGEPRDLRNNPSYALGNLGLRDVIDSIEAVARRCDRPIMIGHSVGGLITQILMSRKVISCGVAISSVAPNAIVDLDWSFLKNVTTIVNPLKGDEPCLMDAETFHNAFANTLSESAASQAFEEYATHDSRNVLRDCLGAPGRVNMELPHEPLLFIGAEKDQITPAHLNEKNARAYKDKDSMVEFKKFNGRSHYICGEPGWEEVAEFSAHWVQRVSGMGHHLRRSFAA